MVLNIEIFVSCIARINRALHDPFFTIYILLNDVSFYVIWKFGFYLVGMTRYNIELIKREAKYEINSDNSRNGGNLTCRM